MSSSIINRKTTTFKAASIAASLTLATLSHAAVVTTTLTGTVGFTGFGTTTGFTTGDAATLSFTYDTATPSTMPNPNQRAYTPGDNGALLSMSLQINSSDPVIGLWNAQTVGGNFGVNKVNAGSPGQLQLTSQINPSPFFTYDSGTPLTPFLFKFDTSEAVIGDQIDASLNAPATYDLAKWNTARGTLYFDNGSRQVQINFTNQVPEPSSYLLLCTAVILGSFRRKR